jgi:hypothetical protein
MKSNEPGNGPPGSRFGRLSLSVLRNKASLVHLPRYLTPDHIENACNQIANKLGVSKDKISLASPGTPAMGDTAFVVQMQKEDLEDIFRKREITVALGEETVRLSTQRIRGGTNALGIRDSKTLDMKLVASSLTEEGYTGFTLRRKNVGGLIMVDVSNSRERDNMLCDEIYLYHHGTGKTLRFIDLSKKRERKPQSAHAVNVVGNDENSSKSDQPRVPAPPQSEKSGNSKTVPGNPWRVSPKQPDDQVNKLTRVVQQLCKVTDALVSLQDGTNKAKANLLAPLSSALNYEQKALRKPISPPLLEVDPQPHVEKAADIGLEQNLPVCVCQDRTAAAEQAANSSLAHKLQEAQAQICALRDKIKNLEKTVQEHQERGRLMDEWERAVGDVSSASSDSDMISDAVVSEEDGEAERERNSTWFSDFDALPGEDIEALRERISNLIAEGNAEVAEAERERISNLILDPKDVVVNSGKAPPLVLALNHGKLIGQQTRAKTTGFDFAKAIGNSAGKVRERSEKETGKNTEEQGSSAEEVSPTLKKGKDNEHADGPDPA